VHRGGTGTDGHGGNDRRHRTEQVQRHERPVAGELHTVDLPAAVASDDPITLASALTELAAPVSVIGTLAMSTSGMALYTNPLPA
jgi:hypothetical protein